VGLAKNTRRGDYPQWSLLNMKVALAHHWLASYRGGEKVLEQIACLFPGSDIHTLICNRQLQIPGLKGHAIIPSVLNRIPKVSHLYRHLLPLHPLAIRNMQVSDEVDVLLSSDASLIKGMTVSEHTTHICYCHSPPRYLWELGSEYKKKSVAARIGLDRFAPMLRRFDYAAAQRVTHFIANSHFVADRISKYYDRESEVIYPPVAVNDFRCDRKRESFALVISELVPYKRIDLAIKAFNKLGKRLIVIGDGSERKQLESMAKPNIEFLGWQPFAALKEHLETATLFVFPGIEDFGITPVEAHASGCPVIAFRAGGALETVIEGRTGAFFDSQNSECLADAVDAFDSKVIDPSVCAAHADSFSTEQFRRKYLAFLSRTLGEVNQVVEFPDHETVAG
jgi:glycosyltransferase involved in cell wall biosynthesis